ncbi:MAG: hypothetical protein WA958_00830 [Tunicatimonas sp.]
MDTNTIMLIALAILVVLSALGIWLANKGSGVEDPHRAMDPVTDDEVTKEHTTTTVKKTEHVKSPDTKVVSDKAAAPQVKVVDNTKKAPSTSKTTPDTKNPPKS